MKTAEEMKREQKEVKLRMILQDYHRRNDYELQQAVNNILALDPLPPAEGAKKVQWSGYGELGNISQKPLQPTAEGAEEILEKLEAYYDFKFHWVEKDRIIRAMHEFAALHAQRLAEKMVEERLRKELIAYDKWLYYKWVEGDVTTTEEHINEYLKSRESHE